MCKNATCSTVGVWGHAPPKFLNLGAVRFLLRLFLGQYDALWRPNNTVSQKEYLPFLPIVSYSMVSAFRSVCLSVERHTLYRWGLWNLPFACKNEKLLEGRLAEQFCRTVHSHLASFNMVATCVLWGIACTQLYVHHSTQVYYHNCTSCSGTQLWTPKVHLILFCSSLCSAPCNHIQKERLLTWVVIVRSSSEIHTSIASPYAQMTLDDHHMEWSGNCNERWIRKRLISYFHTLLGLYVHFKLQDH